MKPINKTIIATTQGYTDFISLDQRHILLYKVNFEQRKSYFCMLSVRTKKIIRTFDIALTFQAIYPISHESKSQNHLPLAFFVSSQKRIFRISNLAGGLPLVEQVNFDSINEEDAETAKTLAATAAPPSENKLKNSCRKNIIVISAQKALAVAFKGGQDVFCINPLGQVTSKVHFNSLGEDDDTKIETIVSVQNEGNKVLVILSNQSFALIDIKQKSRPQVMKIPSLLLKESIVLSCYSEGIYSLAQGEHISLVDFGRSRVIQKICLTNSTSSSSSSSTDDHTTGENIHGGKADYLFKNMLRIGESQFMGQYSIRALGDSRIYFIDFRTSEISSRYSDPNINFHQVSASRTRESFVMMNPSYSSKSIQLVFYATRRN